MIFRAPEPDIVIPDVALTPFLLERAAALRRQAGLHRRADGADADLPRVGRGRAQGGGRAVVAGLPQGGRLCHLQPQPPRVCGRLPRRLAARGNHHHDQPGLHGVRVEPSARGRRRARAGDGSALPRQGGARRSRGRSARGIRLRRGGTAPRRLPRCSRETAIRRPSRSIRARRWSCFPTRAAPRACRRA